MNRSVARIEAFSALYAADTSNRDPHDTDLSARATRYVEGVWEHRHELDVRIGEVTTGWRIERMPPVDRNILRLGLYELTYTETPVGVVISEAVEMAKRYSTAKSGAFVNGVLARLATEDQAPHPS